MKRTVLACVAAGLVATTATANAQVTIDVKKITCQQWLTEQVGDLNHIAIWIHGYVSGKRNNTTIDVQAAKAAVARIKEACFKTLKTPLVEVVQRDLAAKH